MFSNSDISSRFVAAIFSIAVSAVAMATAIVPASPNGIIV